MEWTKKQVDEYIEMFSNYDNSFVIDLFKEKIERNRTVLELGFGTGADYLSLKDFYKIQPTDYSRAFVDKFNEKYGQIAYCLNALTIETLEKFDCIYSNKVLNVFDDSNLQKSFNRQYEVLQEGGVIFHTLWSYDEVFSTEEHYCNSISINKLEQILKNKFVIRDIIKYTEMEEDDSLILIASKIE